VFAIVHGRLEKRAVQPGVRDDARELVQVGAGVAPGDSVITGAIDGLVPGQAVGVGAGN